MIARNRWSYLLLAALVLSACTPGAAMTATPAAPPDVTDLPATPTNDLGEAPTATPTPANPPTEVRPDPSMSEPPPATLTIGTTAQVAGIGSYCWNTSGDPAQGMGLCVDKMGIMTALEPLDAPAGPWTAQFQLPLADLPATVSLNVFPASGEPAVYDDVQGWMPNFEAGQQFELSLEAAPALELDLEPGLYVLGLFVRWEAWGDVFYGFLVQVGEGGGGPAFILPSSCLPAGPEHSPYVDPGGRYCLQYPAYFRIGDVSLDRVNFYGPPLDESIEPVFAALSVQAAGPTEGRTLTEIVDAFVAENGLGLPVTRRALTLGGEPAEVVEGLPGRALSWQAFVIHAGTLYQLSLFPKDPALPLAEPDAQAVWQAVEASFTFLAQ